MIIVEDCVEMEAESLKKYVENSNERLGDGKTQNLVNPNSLDIPGEPRIARISPDLPKKTEIVPVKFVKNQDISVLQN